MKKNEILEEIKDYYENLYSPQGIPDQKIEDFLEDLKPEPSKMKILVDL